MTQRPPDDNIPSFAAKQILFSEKEVDFRNSVGISKSDVISIEEGVTVPDKGDGITKVAKITLKTLDEFGNNKTILAPEQPALDELRKYIAQRDSTFDAKE